MALYKVTIRKGMGAVPAGDTDWTNVYTVSAAGNDNAIRVGEEILNAELICHSTEVHFHAIESRPVIRGSENGRREDLVTIGERTAGTNPLPMWNVVTALFYDLDFSRPERKYLRLPLYSEDYVGGVVNGSLLSTVEGYMVAVRAISAFGTVCGAHGEALIGGDPLSTITMRQTDWHRRGRPGFKRGWVPA